MLARGRGGDLSIRTESFYMKTTRNAAANGSQITRPRFAMVPIRLLESCSDRKGTIFVYGWLWDYAGQADQAFPSVDRLAGQCRMKPDDVRSALRWLTDEGWIERIERPGLTTLFHVRQEALRSPAGQEASPPKGGSPKKGRGPLPQTGDPTPPPKGGPNKMALTRTTEQEVQEPPYPPRGQHRPGAGATDPGPMDGGLIEGPTRDRDGFLIPPSASAAPAAPQRPQEAPQATQPQPVQPAAPRPASQPLPGPSQQPGQSAPVNPKGRKAQRDRFSPTVDDVPAALLPVQRELMAFWPARSGAKTSGAWDLLCSQLQKIQDHPQGGTEIVRDQLEQGAMAGIDGKPWQSIRFANWERYGTKAGTPIIGTGFNGKRSTMDRVMGAIALVEERERRAAERQQAGSRGLALAEVV